MTTDTYWRTPLDLDRWPVPRARVSVIVERCKGCELCVDTCPLTMLEMSSDYNQKGYRYPIVSPGRQHDCTNCGFCQSVCPDFAIVVEEIEGGSA